MVAQSKPTSAAVLAVLALWLAAPIVFAQDAAPATAPAAGEKTPQEKLEQLWENLIHFIKIGQPDAAKSFGQAILDFGAKPGDVYNASVAISGSQGELVRGRELQGMKEICDKLLKLVEEGYKADRSDAERIKEAIELLDGTQRAYLRGRARLMTSGEYAVPHLLRKLEDPKITTNQRDRITLVLPQIGKEAVLPLVAALETKDPQLRQAIAGALGRIEYPHALPRLKEVYDLKDLQNQTRRVVRAALVSCAGGDMNILDKPAAQLCYDLALKFYYRAESLLPDIRTETANVWFWEEELGGLIFKAVPRGIFCDVYAMRYAQLALKHDAKFYPAISLWLAANVKREVGLPAGTVDPTRRPTDKPARFYMLSFGAAYQQQVLARALRDRDWPVAVSAIEALGRTAGAESLVQPVAGGAQPLVEALSSPNRVVRYWAAVSLATALPRRRFTGHELVMPILGAAMRQTGKKTALIVAANEERRNLLKDAARGLGYEVMDASEAAKGLADARAAGGVDVAILADEPDPMVAAMMVRRDPLLATLPLVIGSQTERFQAMAKSDSRVRLVSPGAKSEEISEAVTEVVKASAGMPLTPEQATDWAVRAAHALRGLGLTNTAVYDITRCRPMLLAALDDPRPPVKEAAAAALATIPGPEAQQGIAKLALDAAAEEKMRIAAFEALGESVRRFGNSLSDEQAKAVVETVAKGAGAVQMAAAEILGALSLPSERVKDLVLQGDDGK
jgi:HEAT repeat protein